MASCYYIVWIQHDDPYYYAGTDHTDRRIWTRHQHQAIQFSSKDDAIQWWEEFLNSDDRVSVAGFDI